MEPNQSITSTSESIEVQWSGFLTVPYIQEWFRMYKSWVLNKNFVRLDLEHIQRIDSAGVQLLLFLKKDCLKKGKKISLVKHSFPVLKAFELLGLVSFFGDRIKVKKEFSQELEFRYGTKKG